LFDGNDVPETKNQNGMEPTYQVPTGFADLNMTKKISKILPWPHSFGFGGLFSIQ
jgi:hypothetical protein